MAITVIPTSKQSTTATFLAAATLLGAVCAFIFTSRELVAAVRTQQPVKVEVQPQADVPLAITSIYVTSSDLKQPDFTYEVVNTNNKPISAYAIRHEVTIGATQTSGVTFTSMWSHSSLLQPQSKIVEQSVGTTYGATVSGVMLSVDFVEFADGSTWGADTFKMSEKLAGRRTGGRTALKEFREKSNLHGPGAVSSMLEEEISLAPQVDKSPIWKEGFEEGIKIVRLRLQHAKRKGGLSALESELLKPFDISEEREQ
ncbi:MAG: hypothetical protein QOG71_2909 [Pyrinomonadaceae bacterium]|nr:hypothetical protein [Pyrinomonadaceae bacterium]